LCPVAGARHLAGVLASWGPGSVLFESAKLLANAIPLFADRRLRGIEVDAEHNRRTAERSLRLSTVVGVMPATTRRSLRAERRRYRPRSEQLPSSEEFGELLTRCCESQW
jgi:hypothetical protein